MTVPGGGVGIICGYKLGGMICGTAERERERSFSALLLSLLLRLPSSQTLAPDSKQGVAGPIVISPSPSPSPQFPFFLCHPFKCGLSTR